MTEPVVTIEDGVKRYGTKLALNRVNLQLERGMRCGLLGPNGAGKSTLIRTLTGILRLDEGQVSVLGESSEAARSRVGYLPEERGVPRRAKVGEWLAFLGKLRGLTAQEARKRAFHWLEKVDLPGVERSRCRELSKGMQQKVQLAAALQHEPDLLILDEPFSGLDPVAVQLLEDLIREASERGATILLSTHLLPQAEALCDHVLLLRRGQTLASGPLQQVLAQGNPKIELRAETAPPHAVNIGDDRWIIEAQDSTIDEVFCEAAQWPGVREIRRTGRQLRDFFSEDADA